MALSLSIVGERPRLDQLQTCSIAVAVVSDRNFEPPARQHTKSRVGARGEEV